jgi:two-component system, OmpR family, sensor kinase
VAELKTQVLVSVQTMAASIGRENLVAGPALDKLVKAYAAQVGGRVIVMNANGVVLADSAGTDVGQNYNDGQRPEIAAALGTPLPDGTPQAPHANSLIRFSTQINADLMAAAAPIYDEGVAGAVRVTKDVRSVTDAVRAVTVGLGVVGAGALIAGLLIAYAIAGSLARPLTRLAAAAKRLGEGDLSSRVGEVGGASEIEELGYSFDEMADRLERAVRAQREFVANASHQLRTPLTGMKLRLESAAAQTGDADLKRQLTAADREVDRLSEIVNRLLVMASQIERGEPTHVDLGDSVSRAVARWRERATSSGVIMTSTGAGGAAMAHPADLDQILDNLIDNAIAYAPGPIELETGRVDSAVFVAVRDHGEGIAPHERAHVTERFYRGSKTPSGGSGLGLAIARDLAEKWGGSLTVQTAEGGGTRIDVRLRASDDGEAGPQAPSSLDPAG